MTNSPVLLKKELKAELNNILVYWMNFMYDKKSNGFIGQIDYQNKKNYDAEKGAVMHARILWTFSAAHQFISDIEELKNISKSAFESIGEYFYDKEFGGIFWSINPDNTPKDTKNQIYALAFVIYGMSEYYKISNNPEALEIAVNLYEKIQQHSYDKENKGYFEALTRNWEPIEDLRLSNKDANEKKTMNTHLHIVEAYANLYQVWKSEALHDTIIELLEVIEAHFIDTETGHLKLFFDENWIEKPDVISYGHDIEAAWLLLQCAEVTNDKNLIERYKKYAIIMTDATLEGIDQDGGLWYEFDPHTNELVAEKHWWPQAELLIGFFNAWELTGKQEYLDVVYKNWDFIKKYIIDQANDEWFWGINKDYTIIPKDKAGFWKCPYHNGRACIEVINRIKKHENEKALS